MIYWCNPQGDWLVPPRVIRFFRLYEISFTPYGIEIGGVEESE